MEFNNTEVFNFEGAIRGMRNPMNSWKKSDSQFFICPQSIKGVFLENMTLGENDLQLMQKLIKAGSEHRKFMRQIFISVDITAPLYWWKEFDTYKVGTVGNSTSTMHKIASKEITIDDFEMGDFDKNLVINKKELSINYSAYGAWGKIIDILEAIRLLYNETKDKRYWKELIRLLPESYLQKRTVTMNYENALTMIKQRRNHKLKEWSVDFIGWTKKLPYADELLYLEENE